MAIKQSKPAGYYLGHKPYIHRLIWIVFFVPIFVSGCLSIKDIEGSQEHSGEIIVGLTAGEIFTQTFQPKSPGLNRITFYADLLENSSTGQIDVRLSSTAKPEETIARKMASLTPGSSSVPISLDFEQENNSDKTQYLIRITAIEGATGLRGTRLDRYENGQANAQGNSLVADLAFELFYEYTWLTAVKDIVQNFDRILLFLPSLLALYLPGWLLQKILQTRHSFDLIMLIAIRIGLSFAVIPLLFLWSSIPGLHWSASLYWSIALIAAIGLVSQIGLGLQPRNPLDLRIHRSGVVSTDKLISGSFTLGFIILLLTVCTVRFIMVRDLAGPAWVDSVHHGLIVQLINKTGNLPATYAPYAPGVQASYHSGYHVLQAIFQWLNEIDLLDGMLIFGQILSGSTIFGVYALTFTFTRNKLAGFFAALIAGLMMPMPAYYTSWGRYPHLLAVILLPVAFSLTREIYINHEKGWRTITGATISSAGLFLIHYQVSIFYSLLILSDLIVEFVRRGITGSPATRLRSEVVKDTLFVIGTASLAFLSVSPWLVQILPGFILPKVQSWSVNTQPIFSGFTWAFLNTALGKYANILAFLGLGWSIYRRKSFGWILSAWIIMMFFLANLSAFGFPGGGLINNLQVEITLFLPLAALGGYFLSEFVTVWWNFSPPRIKPVTTAFFITGTILLGGVSARHQATILNPTTFLIRQADREAIYWIGINIPADETILIPPFNWGYGIYAGQDGGYWISPFTLHPTLPPPVLYSLGDDLELIQSIVDLSQLVVESSNDPPRISRLMGDNNINYLFIGARPSAWNPELYMKSDLFLTRYENNGVWIFERTPTP